jgi:hypothetical protein
VKRLLLACLLMSAAGGVHAASFGGAWKITAVIGGNPWSYDVVFNGNRNHVEYEAVLGKDGRLSGTLHLGPMPVMFTAVRE